MLALLLFVLAVERGIGIGKGCRSGNLSLRGRRRGRVSFGVVVVVGVEVKVLWSGSWVLR
jgi:hypothetical protein